MQLFELSSLIGMGDKQKEGEHCIRGKIADFELNRRRDLELKCSLVYGSLAKGGQDRSTNMDYGGKGASDDWNKERRNTC